MNNFDYVKANDTLEAVQQITSKSDAKFVAGGTNLIDLLKYHLTDAQTLIDINHLDVTHGIEERADGGLRLSAFGRNADTAYHPLIEERYPLLSKAILAGASPQIRNMATNGGNLLQKTRCHYFYDENTPCNKREPGSGCSAINGFNRIMAIFGTSDQCIAVFPSDMCVALAALEAVVNISGPEGDRSLAFADFHRLPENMPEKDTNLNHGEMIISIEVPKNNFADKSYYLKVRDRASYAFALVSVAAALEMNGNKIVQARIAMGGVAHKPWRLKEAEKFLAGKAPSDAIFREAAQVAMQGAQGYGHNNFKLKLAPNTIVEALRTATAKS